MFPPAHISVAPARPATSVSPPTATTPIPDRVVREPDVRIPGWMRCKTHDLRGGEGGWSTGESIDEATSASTGKTHWIAVAQQPLEAAKKPSGETSDPKDVKPQAAEAEESRPALPVAGSCSAFDLARIQNAAAGVRRATGQDGEVEGEVITDESGLLMRTPRRSTDRGLYFAAKTGDLQMVQTLLGISNDNEATAAAIDVHSQNLPNTSRSCGGVSASPPPVDLNERGMWDNTPLLVAAQYGHSNIALALLKCGADARAENERGATALHYSSAEGDVDVSQALLDNGANIDPPAAAVHHSFINGGRSLLLTPLFASAGGGHTELVRLLLDRGAEVDRRIFPETPRSEMSKESIYESSRCTSALMEAARYGHTDTCTLLIDKGASLLAQDSDGRTAFMHATYGSHEKTAKALLLAAEATGHGRCLSEAGEFSTQEGHPGLKPLQLACDKDLHVVVEALLSAGVDVNTRDPSGATTLLRTCRNGSAWCVGELLSRGADPLAADKYEDTPLLAARNRHPHRANEEAILKLVEAAVAAREAKAPLSADPELEIEQGAANEDGKNHVKNNPNETLCKDDGEAVLLVSDLNSDEDLEGFDIRDGNNVPIETSTASSDDANTPLEDVDSAIIVVVKENSGDDRENDTLLLGDYEVEATGGENPLEVLPKDEAENNLVVEPESVYHIVGTSCKDLLVVGNHGSELGVGEGISLSYLKDVKAGETSGGNNKVLDVEDRCSACDDVLGAGDYDSMPATSVEGVPIMPSIQTANDGGAEFKEAKGRAVNEDTERDRANDNVLSVRNSMSEITEGKETFVEASLVTTSVEEAMKEERDKGRSPIPVDGDENDPRGPDQALSSGNFERKAVDQEHLSSICSPSASEGGDARNTEIDSVTIEARSWSGSSASARKRSGSPQLDEDRPAEPEGSNGATDDIRCAQSFRGST